MRTRHTAHLAALLALAFVASVADASPFRLHIRGKSASSVNQTLSIRSTQTQDVAAAMAAAVSPCTSSELISVTYTGPVVAQVFANAALNDRGSATVARTFRKIELTGPSALVTADTASASDATSASLWTVSCAGGTYKIGWNVATPELLSWDYGADSFARRGGFPLYYLTGGATDWTITTNPSSGFEIYNQRLVWACSGGSTACPADGDTSAVYETGSGASKVISAPTGSYSVVLHSNTLGVSKTITINAIQHQYDVAPTPAFLNASTGLDDAFTVGGQVCDALAGTSTGGFAGTRNWGDTIVMEGSKEHPAAYQYYVGSRCTTSSSSVRATRSGGPSKPAAPYDVGWVTMKPRDPWAATVDNLAVDLRGMSCTECGTHHDLGVRFSQIDAFTPGSTGIKIQDTGVGTQYTSLVQYDHNYLSGLSAFGATAGVYSEFATDNYTDGSGHFGGTFQVFSYDGKVDGNRFINVSQDGIDYALLDSGGTHLSSISWNQIYSLRSPTDCGHPDFMQMFYNVPGWLTGLVGDKRGPAVVGNILVHGTGPAIDSAFLTLAHASGCPVVAAGNGDLGHENTDADGALGSDIGGSGEVGYSTEFVGNILVNSFHNGMTDQWQATGTLKRHNLLAFPVYVTNGTTSGYPRAFISQADTPIIFWNGVGAVPDIRDNALQSVIASPGTFGFTGPAAFASNNQQSLADNQFADPYNTDYSTLQAILDHWKAKTGSAYETSAAGPLYDISKIDIRGRAVDSSLLVADVSIGTRPTCNTTETITKSWGATAVAGNTATVSVAATFNNAGGATLSDLWVISGSTPLFDPSTLPRPNGTTYTVTTGDLGHGSGTKLQHFKVATTAAGSGQCTSNTLSMN